MLFYYTLISPVWTQLCIPFGLCHVLHTFFYFFFNYNIIIPALCLTIITRLLTSMVRSMAWPLLVSVYYLLAVACMYMSERYRLDRLFVPIAAQNLIDYSTRSLNERVRIVFCLIEWVYFIRTWNLHMLWMKCEQNKIFSLHIYYFQLYLCVLKWK